MTPTALPRASNSVTALTFEWLLTRVPSKNILNKATCHCTNKILRLEGFVFIRLFGAIFYLKHKDVKKNSKISEISILKIRTNLRTKDRKNGGSIWKRKALAFSVLAIQASSRHRGIN
jgi:hypothetical protein